MEVEEKAVAFQAVVTESVGRWRPVESGHLASWRLTSFDAIKNALVFRLAVRLWLFVFETEYERSPDPANTVSMHQSSPAAECLIA